MLVIVNIEGSVACLFFTLALFLCFLLFQYFGDFNDVFNRVVK